MFKHIYDFVILAEYYQCFLKEVCEKGLEMQDKLNIPVVIVPRHSDGDVHKGIALDMKGYCQLRKDLNIIVVCMPPRIRLIYDVFVCLHEMGHLIYNHYLYNTHNQENEDTASDYAVNAMAGWKLVYGSEQMLKEMKNSTDYRLEYIMFRDRLKREQDIDLDKLLKEEEIT